MSSTRLLALALLAATASSCMSAGSTRRASVLEFLYPEGSPALPPADVRLDLPVRVGLAFAPASNPHTEMLTESQRQQLLTRVAEAFRGREGIEGIDVVPSTHLSPGGGFQNLDRLRSMYGFDLMALVSYDQTQFDDSNKASLTYWTIVGAYFIPGEDTDTHTFVDLAVFDIPSRTMLLSASGNSRVTGSSTAVDVGSDLREHGEEGFQKAFAGLIAELEVSLAAFREQAKTGTVRGAGTPAVEVVRADGAGGTGVGAHGSAEVLALLALAAACGLTGRRPARASRRA
jgi:rhombotail lipoprotein